MADLRVYNLYTLLLNINPQRQSTISFLHRNGYNYLRENYFIFAKSNNTCQLNQLTRILRKKE